MLMAGNSGSKGLNLSSSTVNLCQCCHSLDSRLSWQHCTVDDAIFFSRHHKTIIVFWFQLHLNRMGFLGPSAAFVFPASATEKGLRFELVLHVIIVRTQQAHWVYCEYSRSCWNLSFSCCWNLSFSPCVFLSLSLQVISINLKLSGTGRMESEVWKTGVWNCLFYKSWTYVLVSWQKIKSVAMILW